MEERIDASLGDKQLAVLRSVARDSRRLKAALEAAGFIDGKYGTLPYALEWAPGSALWREFEGSVASATILVDKRIIGHAIFDAYGECQVVIDLSTWMDPTKYEDKYSGRIKIPTFPIGPAKVSYADVATTRYSPINRAQMRAKVEAELSGCDDTLMQFKKAAGL
jgi:hypothetical protein